MAQDLSYAAMDKEKADAQAAQQAQLEAQKRDAEQKAQAEAEKNPALQAATSNLANRLTPQQQGLNPNAALGEYSLLAGEVANASTSAEDYSNNMIRGVEAGKLDPRMVLEDASVLPQYREALYNSMQQQSQPQGLGSIR